MLRKFMTGFVVLAVFLTATATVDAGGSDYLFSIGDASGSAGDSFTTAATMDNNGGEVQGWSFGVCHDETALTITDAVSGADTQTVQNGAPAGFEQISTFANGATQGVVICFTGCAVIAPGTANFEMLTMDYDIIGASSTDICFCDTLGSPAVSTVAVVAGASIPPATTCGQVSIINPNQLIASSGTAVLGEAAATTLSLNNVTMGAVDAVQMNITYDDTILTSTGVTPLFAYDFFAVQAGGTSGEIVMGAVADTTPPLDNQIPAGAQTDLASLEWTASAEGSSAIAWVDGLGNPAQDNAVVTGQTTPEQPTLVDGSMAVVNYNSFLRGDCNSDDNVNIADGIYGINWLFQGGPEPTCDDACDTNDDGTLDAADMIYIFNYRFLDGPMPSAPFPSSDLDPTAGDGLGCNGDADDI